VDALVSYRCTDGVATITMDDGKANVLSPAMLGSLNDALDSAADDTAVLLTGRPGMFSAGFDLSVLRGGGEASFEMLMGGFSLARRLLSWPRPVVVACSGHAIAMGVFLLLSGDYRIGASGEFKLTANEVAIGLTMPRTAIEICRQRLTPAAFTRAVLLSEVFGPAESVPAGFLDRVVDASELAAQSRSLALQLGGLSAGAHAGSKARARQTTLAAIDVAIAADNADLRYLL
jgi:enoyl-CoA hydratase